MNQIWKAQLPCAHAFLVRQAQLENLCGTLLMDLMPLSGSSKRARADREAVQAPSCLVDGCVADLSKCREYHQRHKVCEAHSKTSRVTIFGQEQRFCQQCSRFHSLGEFDDSKRSCRKRLDGHNRRRRKPQPSHQGPKFLSYGAQYFPNNPVATSCWNDAVKAQNSHLCVPSSQLSFATNNFPSSFLPGYRGEKQPHLNGDSCSSSSSSHNKLLFSDGFDRVIDSDRASSLLSSSTHSETRGFIPKHFIMHPAQPSIIPTAHYDCLVMNSSSLVADSSSNNGNMDCAEMIQSGSNAFHQTIAFSWE